MIWRAHTFGPTGLPITPQSPPALRVEGGYEATVQQRNMAQVVFAQFCVTARVSQGSNPTQAGLLPDGTPYKITTVGPQTIMQIWPRPTTEILDRLLPGIRFDVVVDGVATHAVVSPPRPPIGAWVRKTVDVEGGLSGLLAGASNVAPIGYRRFVRSFKAPTPAGYFFQPEEYIGGGDVALVQFGGLARLGLATGTSVAANIAFGATASTILARSQSYSGIDSDRVLSFTEPYTAGVVPLKGTGSEFTRVKGEPWKPKTLTVVSGDPALELQLISLPTDYRTTGVVQAVTSFSGAKEFAHVQVAKKLSDRANDPSPPAELRLFQFPTRSFIGYSFQFTRSGALGSRYWGYELSSPGVGITPSTAPPIEDEEDRFYGLAVDGITGGVDRVIDFAALLQDPAPPVYCRWWDATVLGGITGMKQDRPIGVGMRCTASGPIPTYSWSVSPVSPPGTYLISTGATFSGAVEFHGVAETRFEYLLEPAFVGGLLELARVSEMETFEITNTGSRSFSHSGSTTVFRPDGPVPEEPEITNIYTAPVDPGNGGAQSYSMTTVLRHVHEAQVGLGEFGTIYLKRHSLTETTESEGSGTITTAGTESGTVHARNANQLWHFEQRTVYVFDPELHLLCYAEFAHDGDTTTVWDATVFGESYNAYPMPPPAEIPPYRVVILHRGRRITLTSKPAFPSDDEQSSRALFVSSYHPAAGVPPGFPGGTIPFVFSHAAGAPVSGYWGRGASVLDDTEIGLVLDANPMNAVPASVTTDVVTGAQPSGPFLTNYSGRGRFRTLGFSGLQIRYQRSPDGLGAILHIGRPNTDYPVPDFGEKTYLVTASAISEMPESMRSGLDFSNMNPF